MIKFAAALILSLSSVATVVYAEHGGDRGDDRGSDRGDYKGHSFAAPEIDPSSAISALTLLLGGVVVLRRRVATKR